MTTEAEMEVMQPQATEAWSHQKNKEQVLAWSLWRECGSNLTLLLTGEMAQTEPWPPWAL